VKRKGIVHKRFHKSGIDIQHTDADDMEQKLLQRHERDRGEAHREREGERETGDLIASRVSDPRANIGISK
jgi:hypothetical protein